MTEPIKSDYADLLNDLDEMQGSWQYALRRGVLQRAEQAIVNLELENRQLKAARVKRNPDRAQGARCAPVRRCQCPVRRLASAARHPGSDEGDVRKLQACKENGKFLDFCRIVVAQSQGVAA